jgi:hypothetical protein
MQALCRAPERGERKAARKGATALGGTGRVSTGRAGAAKQGRQKNAPTGSNMDRGCMFLECRHGVMGVRRWEPGDATPPQRRRPFTDGAAPSRRLVRETTAEGQTTGVVGRSEGYQAALCSKVSRRRANFRFTDPIAFYLWSYWRTARPSCRVHSLGRILGARRDQFRAGRRPSLSFARRCLGLRVRH